MTKRIALSIFAFIFVGCVPNHATILPDAVVSDDAGGCKLVLKSFIPDMTHDPISFLFRGQSEMDGIVTVPTLSGTYTAQQVQVVFQFPGSKSWPVQQLSGNISFAGNKLRIDMLQQDKDTNSSFFFNGTFTLENSESCRAK